jgi:outer membrane lipoprotein SlyB
MRKTIIAAAAIAVLAPATPAFADPPPWAPAHGRRARDAERALTYRDEVWRDRDGRYRCRRGDGSTGLIVGAAAGALIGRSLDRGRSRTLGTLIGAGAGALLGREIDRGNLRCR